MVDLSDYLGSINPMLPEVLACWDLAVSADDGSGIYVPPGDWLLPASISVDRLLGVKGRSIIHLLTGTVLRDPRHRFAIYNRWYSDASYNEATASIVKYEGITIRVASNTRVVPLGLANVASGEILDCDFEAAPSASDSNVIGAMVDFYACCKNVTVTKSRFANKSRSSIGGGNVWIRNLVAVGGNLPENSTEKIVIDDCDFDHDNIDESIAIYGVCGITRYCHVRNSRIVSSGLLHRVLLTIFPCDTGEGIDNGDNAAVYGNSFDNNEIWESAATVKVIRIGYNHDDSDLDNQCYNNKVINNTLHISTPPGVTLVSTIECDEDAFDDYGPESGNYAGANTIILSDTSHATVALTGFTNSGINTIVGPFSERYSDYKFEPICDAFWSDVDGGRYVRPSVMTEEQIRIMCAGIFPRDIGGVWRYYGGPS